MKFIIRLWSWLNGKKTFLGFATYFVLGGLHQIGIVSDSSFNSLLPWVDGIIGIGVAHKIKKALF